MYTIFDYKMTSSKKTTDVILKTTELYSQLAHFKRRIGENHA